MSRAPLSHNAGPETERAAAGSVAHVAVPLRGTVRAIIAAAYPDGVTDDEGGEELALITGHLGDRLTFGRRRHELVLDGLVEDSGTRRLTPSGRSAVVWRLARAA